MSDKRFKLTITLQGEDEIWDSESDCYCKIHGAIIKLNNLHEENIFLKEDNRRMVKFLLSEGYALKDYLKFIKEDKK